MKKFWSLFLVLALSMSLCACGDSASSTEAENTVTEEAAEEAAETEEVSEDAEAEEAAEEEVTISELVPDVEVEEFDIPDTEGIQFVQNLTVGWNLGNTFEAYDCTWLSNELAYETAWVTVETTEDHIQAVADAGFNTVRIPVSWHNHVDEDYNISEVWLNRVTEVVDWCIERDLYVVINIHHDNSTDYMYPSSEYLEQSIAYTTAIWSQLSEHFKEYDEHLIFETLNEPRLVGSTYEWWISNSSEECKDAIACINEINQAIVDTIRASGGNNETRYIMCPGYDASADGALNSGFVLPTDPIESNDHHIIVSVHAYTPYDFALNESGTDSWSSSSSADMSNLTTFMDKLYKNFVSQGIPVVIGEFGAMNKDNLEARVDWAANFIANAKARGMVCFWWDNNAFSDGETFGLLRRLVNKWWYQDIVDAIMTYAY